MKQQSILLLTLNDAKLLQMGWYMSCGTFRNDPVSFWNLCETLLAIPSKEFNSSIKFANTDHDINFLTVKQAAKLNRN